MLKSALQKVSITVLTVLSLVWITPDLIAQQGMSKGKQVKIKITRSEEGNSYSVNRTEPAEGRVNLAEILRRYDIIDEFGDLADGEAVEIIIRRKRPAQAESAVAVEVEPTVESYPSEEPEETELPPAPEPVAAADEDGPFLGVRYEDLQSDHPTMLEIPEVRGVIVTDILLQTSAAESGLENGDVITAINEEHLTSNLSMIDVVSRYEPGDRVEVTYYRNTKKRKTHVVLGRQGDHQIYTFNYTPENGGDLEVASPSANAEDLMELHEDLTEEHAERIKAMASAPSEPVDPMSLPPSERAFLGVNGMAESDAQGAQVSDILSNSTGADLGLKDGDIITSLNGAPIGSFDDLSMIMGYLAPGDFITVEFTRGEEVRSASARIKSKKETFTMPVAKAEPKPEPKKPAPAPQPAAAKPKPQPVVWETYAEIVTKVELEEVEATEAESFSRRTGHEVSGQNNLEILDLDLYPNPNAGLFNLTFSLPEQGDVQIRFMNVEGKLFYAEDLPGFSGKYEKELDFSYKERGIYYLRIVQDGHSMLKKIVLQ